WACASLHCDPRRAPLLEWRTLQSKLTGSPICRKPRMTVKEKLPEPSNPLGIDGLEFVEYATSQPGQFGALLLKLGFAAVARHRSREVMLYRQGAMNLIVNAHEAASATPLLSAFALRVRDAAQAHKHSLDRGAWDMPTRASAMELNIPGIHGVAETLIYFVDRYQDFSIYDVDFVPLAGTQAQPPAVAGLHWFGVVQSILGDRTGDWLDFYQNLFGFTVLPRGAEDVRWDEGLVRVGLGAADVPAAVKALQSRGIVFVDRGSVQPSEKGALTQPYLGGVTFELVHSHLK